MDKSKVVEEKKQYTSPKLIEYGNLAEITGGGQTEGNDTALTGSLEV